MAKILVAVSGLKGLLFSSFEVLRRLENAGHQVILASPANVRDWTDVNGFSFIQLPNFLEYTLPQKAYVKILSIISERRALEKRVKDLKIDELIDIFEAEQFDLLLCDLELHEVVLAAFEKKLKTVLLCQFFNLAENHRIPTIQSLSKPADKSDFSNDWAELKQQKRESENNQFNPRANRKQALLEKAKQINFPTRYWQQYTWPLPFVYVNFPTISLTMEELDFFQEGEHFHYVGHTIYEDRQSPNSEEFPLQLFLSKKEEGSKIVLVTLSTMKTSEIKFINVLSNIAKSHPEWEIIVNSHAKRIEKPENLHLFEFIPQLEILKIADLSINHGGINTINECIHFKVPMIIVSGNQHDQNGNTARCFYHGIALKAKPKSLESCIIKGLDDESLKKSMDDIHQVYQSYQESKRLEAVVNQYLK